MNDVEQQFRDAKMRTLRHWFEDGLAETITGIAFITLAVFFVAQSAATGTRGLAMIFLNLLFPVLVIGGCLLSRRLIRSAKERYVYPRTGYVVYAKPGRWPKWVSGALGGAVAGLTVALIRTAPDLESWIPAFEGFVIGAFLWWQGRSAGVSRLTGIGLLSTLIGVLISLGHFSTYISGALFFGVLGITTLVSGRLVFRRFLQDAPPPEKP